MGLLSYQGRHFEMLAGESVLECLLRQGVQVPNSCRAGVCQSCLMRAREGSPPESSQRGLKETMKGRGYFLACLCRPESNLGITEAEDDLKVPGTIAGVGRLSASVVEVRLRCERRLDYRPGQYVTIIRTPDGLARSYSIASLPEEGTIALHVRKITSGRMSTWLHEEARPGDPVAVQGPAGDCFYVPGRAEQPLLLVGTGTGLAPLYGIVRDALRSRHSGPIRLIHGAVEPSGLYLRRELEELTSRHPHFEY